MRVLATVLLLSLSPAALACGDAPCGDNCPMKNHHVDQTAVDKVMAAEGTKLTLAVSGVHCMGTAGHVKALLDNTDGVNASAVEVSGETVIAFDEKKVTQAALIEAINKLDGYEAKVSES